MNHSTEAEDQEDGLTPMGAYLKEPAGEYGLAFVRADIGMVLSIKSYETEYQEAN